MQMCNASQVFFSCCDSAFCQSLRSHTFRILMFNWSQWVTTRAVSHCASNQKSSWGTIWNTLQKTYGKNECTQDVTILHLPCKRWKSGQGSCSKSGSVVKLRQKFYLKCKFKIRCMSVYLDPWRKGSTLGSLASKWHVRHSLTGQPQIPPGEKPHAPLCVSWQFWNL